MAHGYRISQITQDGQGWIALIRHKEVVARFTNWVAAKAVYQLAVKSSSK